MDTKEFIASGILEHYVLGVTSPQETAEVESRAAADSEIWKELEALRTSIEEYALQFEKQPPEALKARIMTEIAGNANFSVQTAAVADAELENHSQSNIKPLNPQSKIENRKSNLAIAASVALLISLLGNLLFYNNWQKTEEKLAISENQNVKIAGDLKVTQASYVAVNQEIRLIESADYQKIKVAGTPDSPNLKAVIYWNKAKSEVYLSGLSELPAISADQQYQLWAIIDGKPIEAGLISGSDSLQQLKSFAKADAFAISLEAKGGSTTEKGPLGKVVGVGKV